MARTARRNLRLIAVGSTALLLVLGTIPAEAFAGPARKAPTSVQRGGGGRPASRPQANNRAPANRGGGRAGYNNRPNNNRVSSNRVNNNNVNINRNVNVDVDRGWDDDGWDHHPVARGVAFGTAAAVTSAVVGSMVNTLPPSCRTVVYSGVSYSECGGVWYQPQYMGSSVTYVVVNQPY